jgi:hypothetical protein
MRDWLSPGQREQFDKSGYFEVFGCATRKRYRIYHVRVAPNVYEVDDMRSLKVGICFLPTGRLVSGDVMLAQKIALETDEHSAIAVANKFSVRALPRKNLGRDQPVSASPGDLTALCRMLAYHCSINASGDDNAQATGF